ncbi:serine/threonine-protein phosphatase 6 regulatory ankyrin repeat subunit A-like [Corticium candelabrum]|uniref:serine/threonine-protein phosphatase 6 regulatory ankyrin repeat subunit A-like n=1 Tax=Corticium candelabrum TaxID=121492 RepID=UPI002E25CAD9|nr:serine/threonine-protein phosphatase 6 regulatory ankyrin repeat subunit A-like [Corticium candelabrum]
MLLKLKPSAIKHMITVACDDGYPIHLACHYSSLDVIRLLISHYSLLNKFNSFGCTPLMVCCQSGQYQTVQLLLGASADPNLVSPISKKTAMHWAVNRRDLQRVWLLFQFFGDQRTPKDGLNVTPRQMAELARATRKGERDILLQDFLISTCSVCFDSN